MSDKKEKKSILDKFSLLQKLKGIKHIELILVCIFAIILVIVYSSTKSTSSVEISNSEFSTEDYSIYLEDKLSNILSGISGAGKVNVMITLDGGMNYEYATEKEEVTTTTDVGGSTNTKTTINEEVVIVTINGKSTPLIIKESYPKIIGVVIVASGAVNAQVKLNIMRATVALLNVEENNIEILVGNS
ncbi:MAG: hypothetical protein E7376_00435 [Clostridiales bacterium]|nr:hypothetical protein [Clostridiales bacterium]